jgi:nicotinate phosphoribosyltransferase
MAGDTLSVENDNHNGELLIHQVMRAGKHLTPLPTLTEIRTHAARELERVPGPLHELKLGATYSVQIGEALVDLAADFDRHLSQQERKPA